MPKFTFFAVKFLCVLILVKKKNLNRLPLFRKYDYDTLKIEHHAHGAKSNDPVINKHDDDKLIIKPDLPLRYTLHILLVYIIFMWNLE